MEAIKIRFSSLSPLHKPQSKSQILNFISFRCVPPHFSSFLKNKSNSREVFTLKAMSNRSKNRRPLQRGRTLSIEAMQAVQALIRAKNDPPSLRRVFRSKIERLIKSDLVAVLRELQRQNEGLLSLQVFEEIRKEDWYKPQVSVYADTIAVLASNSLLEEIQQLFSYMKMESLDADIESFNALLRTFMDFSLYHFALECFYLMNEVGCEPDESTFRILINGFESKGQTDLSAIVRQEAEKYFGGSLEFLEQKEEEGMIPTRRVIHSKYRYYI